MTMTFVSNMGASKFATIRNDSLEPIAMQIELDHIRAKSFNERSGQNMHRYEIGE